jgi:hypothetical protein
VITIAVDPAEPEAGTRGTATVCAEGGPTGAERISMEVGWRTEGRGDPDSAVIHSAEFVRDGAASTEPWSVAVDFEVPAAGPVSYDGKILRIIWEVRVTAFTDGEQRTQVEAFRVTPRLVTA